MQKDGRVRILEEEKRIMKANEVTIGTHFKIGDSEPNPWSYVQIAKGLAMRTGVVGCGSPYSMNVGEVLTIGSDSEALILDPVMVPLDRVLEEIRRC